MLILSIGSGILAAVLVHFLVSPYLKKKILREVYGDEQERTLSATSDGGASFSKSAAVPEHQENKQDTSGEFINLIILLPRSRFQLSVDLFIFLLIYFQTTKK